MASTQLLLPILPPQSASWEFSSFHFQRGVPLLLSRLLQQRFIWPVVSSSTPLSLCPPHRSRGVFLVCPSNHVAALYHEQRGCKQGACSLHLPTDISV